MTPQLLPDVLAVLDDETKFTPAQWYALDFKRLQSVLDAFRTMKTAARPATERLAQIGSRRRDHVNLEIGKTLHTTGAGEGTVVGILTYCCRDPDPEAIPQCGGGTLDCRTDSK